MQMSSTHTQHTAHFTSTSAGHMRSSPCSLLSLVICSPASFSVSVGLLVSSYKRLQKKLHPDKFAQASKVALRSQPDNTAHHTSSATTPTLHTQQWQSRCTIDPTELTQL